VILFGLAWHFAARAFGEEWVPTWLGMAGDYYRDAFWIALGGSALLIGLQAVSERGVAVGGLLCSALCPIASHFVWTRWRQRPG